MLRRFEQQVRLLVLLLPLLFAGATRPAAAQFNFSLDPASGLRGAFVTLTGNIANTADPSSDPVDVNFLVFGTVSGPTGASTALTFDTNTFYNNVPGVFFGGDTYTGPIFGIQIAPGAQGGIYTGSVTLQGGADQNATDTLATTTFTLQVLAAPEPATISLLAVGLAALVLLSPLQRRAQRE